MLLALDVGNSNVTIGAFEKGALVDHWRLRTIRDQSADEWGILLRNLFAQAPHDIAAVSGMIIGSVVPPVDQSLAHMARRYFKLEPMFVTPETDTGLTIRYDNPKEVGADRIENGLAAFHKYGGPCVVVDLGTAITFDVVSAQAEYLGGIITAGIGISAEALFSRTARLPLVGLDKPARLIGTNTVASIQSGMYHGSLAMIDGIVERLIAELGPETRVVATGGQAGWIAHGSRYLKHIDEHLTLEGLRLIWERNHRV